MKFCKATHLPFVISWTLHWGRETEYKMGSYACMRKSGHEGKHKDVLGREWEDSEEVETR